MHPKTETINGLNVLARYKTVFAIVLYILDLIECSNTIRLGEVVSFGNSRHNSV